MTQSCFAGDDVSRNASTCREMRRRLTFATLATRSPTIGRTSEATTPSSWNLIHLRVWRMFESSDWSTMFLRRSRDPSILRVLSNVVRHSATINEHSCECRVENEFLTSLIRLYFSCKCLQWNERNDISRIPKLFLDSFASWSCYFVIFVWEINSFAWSNFCYGTNIDVFWSG